MSDVSEHDEKCAIAWCNANDGFKGMVFCEKHSNQWWTSREFSRTRYYQGDQAAHTDSMVAEFTRRVSAEGP